MQAWHLLCLLLTAQGEWASAVTAGEAGVGVWEEEEAIVAAEVDNLAPGMEAISLDPTIESKDFAKPSSPAPPARSVDSPRLLLPTGIITALPAIAPPTPSKQIRLEQVIQLRMTLAVITEKLQGPETAMLKQQELFAFFSGRAGRTAAAGAGTSDSRSMIGAPSIAGSVLRGSAPVSAGGEATGGALGESFVAVHETAPGPPGLGESMLTGKF